MLGSKQVGTTYIDSVNASEARSGDARAWLRSSTAEVWAKFLLALVGLGLAFGAALFSTASGEAGHLWASVILASVALLMAAFVGLVTVPYPGAAGGAGATAADISLRGH